MMVDSPQLSTRLDGAHTPAEIITRLDQDLAQLGWRGQPGDPGHALVRLFGRLSELIITRLDQVPDKHFLAFLNTAGIDRLPPRPASTEVTFTPAKDAPSIIRVPAGTQIATPQTKTEPEIIFETGRDLTVLTNSLIKCVAFDPVNFTDGTALITGAQSGALAAFRGEHERERLLCLRDDDLFAWADEVNRQATTLTLGFEFEHPGQPKLEGDWTINWRYGNGQQLTDLVAAGASIEDSTDDFRQDGCVTLTRLPAILPTLLNGESGLWLACQLTGGTRRDHLPVIKSLSVSRQIDLPPAGLVIQADGALTALQSNSLFVPLNLSGEFLPLGQRPARLDTFYLRADAAFNKAGATVKITLDVQGISETLSDDSELARLQIEWAYSSPDGWTTLATTSQESVVPASFTDTTKALTTSGDIQFNIPADFAKTKVNAQDGYWLRARVIAGSYDATVTLTSGGNNLTVLKTFAPLIERLTITCSNYHTAVAPRSVAYLHSCVDSIRRELLPGQPFAPFNAPEEGPALYLGFKYAFPAREWVQWLLDVTEPDEALPADFAVRWEYWTGDLWESLPVSDETRQLRDRGFLGFFAPENQPASTEFGQEAHWFRAWPPHPPVARAGDDQTLLAAQTEATGTLDASASFAVGQNTALTHYRWRLISSTPPVADAGDDQHVYTARSLTAVTLDASRSRGTDDRSISSYEWRLVEESAPVSPIPIASAYLNGLRLNTVPALNASTHRDEILGSSSGQPDQVFTCALTPVLPDLQVWVCEPDQPTATELDQLELELQAAESEAGSVTSTVAAASGVWVRWQRVTNFHASTAASRHFTLDPIAGQIQFGDGQRGKIPSAGRDNVRIAEYRTHAGALGNVAPGAISVVRNPGGDLAHLKHVTNFEAAGGGSDAERLEDVKQRGPQSLKHRARAVTVEDFAWLAREASSEIAQAYCLPGRNAQGLFEPGWVTVVITPQSSAARPIPSPALLRRIQAYLADRALINLKSIQQLCVIGPDYVQVSVAAKVAAVRPEQADAIKLAVIRQLNAFLHPLRGGPLRKGWALGRAVYLSEVCAEIEAVPGVEHVRDVRLASSLQQSYLRLMNTAPAPDLSGRYSAPADSQVCTFDERIRLRLAGPLATTSFPDTLAVSGFKVGDQVAIVGLNNVMLKPKLTIAALTTARVMFAEPFDAPTGWGDRRALQSLDLRLRLPLDTSTDDTGLISSVTITSFQRGENTVCIVANQYRDPRLEFLTIERVDACTDRVWVPAGCLVYAGQPDIEMVVE